MRSRHRCILFVALVSAGVGLALVPDSRAAPPPVKQIERLELTLVPLVVEDGSSTRLEPSRIEVGSGRTETVRIDVPWRPGDERRFVAVVAASIAPTADAAHRVGVRFVLEGGPRGVDRGERTVEIRDGTNGLVEVHSESGRRLVLAIEAARVSRIVVDRPTGAEAPVRFSIEIFRLLEEREIALESNRLTTFVGRSVSYAFRLGDAERGRRVAIRLTPRSIDGDVVEVELEVLGAIEDGRDDPLYVDRSQILWTSRGVANDVDVASVDGSDGYRFRVRVDF